MRHFFTISFIIVITNCSYKYNLGESRFESASVSLFGVTLEYSVVTSYKSQIYFGVDTGVSMGLGIGGYVGVRGGWRFDWWSIK